MRSLLATLTTLISLTTIATFISLAQSPDTFTWIGGADGNWSDSGAWSPASTSRTAPDFPGDIVAFTYNAAVTMDYDKTLSKITFPNGGVLRRGSDPVTLVFDNGGDASLVNTLQFGTNAQTDFFEVGNSVVNGTDPDFAVSITDQLRVFFSTGGDNRTRVWLRGKITGGAVGAPVGLNVDYQGGTWGANRLIIMNPDNDFVGDLLIGQPGVGNNISVGLGQGSAIGYNSILGHPSNKVFFRGNSCVLFVRTGDSGGLRRHVIGHGNIGGGSFDNGNNMFSADDLRLGDGFIAEPMQFLSNGTTNQIGTINFILGPNDQYVPTRTISMHDDAQFRVTLGAPGSGVPGVSDKLNFSARAPLTFNGKIIIEALDDYPLGSYWDIISVDYRAGTFTFNPTFVSPGYITSVNGNMSSGWTVRVTKVRDISSVPDISTLPVNRVGDTYATFNFDALGVEPEGFATVRAYIGESGDKGETVNGWDRVVECPAVVVNAGPDSFRVDGLALGGTYTIRHSISNAAGEFVSLDSATFTTRPLDTPDVFRLAVDSGVWHDETSWEHDSPYDRHIPDLVGDIAQIYMGTPPVSKTINLTNDATISALRVYQGNNGGHSVVIRADDGPATLVFDTDSPATPAQIHIDGQLQTINFGVTAETNLTIHLARPLNIHAQRDYNHTFNFHAKLTGGTVMSSDFYTSSGGNEYNQMFITFHNTNNTFRGDILIGAATQSSPGTRLVAGNWAMTDINGTFGHPDNRIYLRSSSEFRLNPHASAPLNLARFIGGNGPVTTAQYDQYGNLSHFRPLAFTSATTLAPSAINGSNYGTITINASSLTDDPDTTYLLDLDYDGAGNDKINFNIQSPLTLTGKLEFNVNSAKPPLPGTTWTIARVNPHANLSQFDCKLSKPAGYKIEAVGNSATGWDVVATALPMQTLIIIK